MGMGLIRSKIGEKKGLKWGLFWFLSFMKIPQVSSSLDQKEQNCFGPPKLYTSIAPMFKSDDMRVSVLAKKPKFYK